jgi:hypothetical protein
MMGRMIPELKSSSKRIGQLYPILVDYHGNIIDGEHRYSVDEGWRTIRLEHIRTEKDRLIARIISNTVRRSVPRREKTELLAKLGEIYLNDGVEPGRIAYKISEETGMTCRWVTKYLSDKFKDPLQSKRASSAERRSAGNSKPSDVKKEEPKEIAELTAPPEKQFLTVKKYANTHFVNVMVEKPFYTRLEKVAEKLETTPDVLINNALLLILKRLEEKVGSKNEKRRQDTDQA